MFTVPYLNCYVSEESLLHVIILCSVTDWCEMQSVFVLCRPEETAIPAAVSLLPLATNHASDVLDMPVDPNEPTYCLCHQVSYGEMIGCDNQDVRVVSYLLIITIIIINRLSELFCAVLCTTVVLSAHSWTMASWFRFAFFLCVCFLFS